MVKSQVWKLLADTTMEYWESDHLVQCISCSAVLTKPTSLDDLAETVCQQCGTLQGKEITQFESSSLPIAALPRSFDFSASSSFKKFVAKMSTIVNTLNLPSHLTQQAIDLAERIYDDHVLKKQKCGAKMTACIHYVTRNNGFFIPLEKLSSATQTHVNHVNKCLNLCIKRLRLARLPYLDYIFFLKQYSEIVDNKSQSILMEWAKGLEAIVEITGDGISPTVAAAALLLVVLEGRETPFDFKGICKKFSINYQNVKNIASKVRKRLLSFSQQIPWKPSTLNEKTIASFLPEILKYHEQFMEPKKLHEVNNDSSHIEEKIKLASETRAENGKFDIKMEGDPVYAIIWKLLDKGCSEGEILKERLSSLSQKYLDYTDDLDFSDHEIPDEEIEALLKKCRRDPAIIIEDI